MAVQTVVAPRQSIKLVVVAVICAVLAVWAAYENLVTFPRAEADAKRFTELKTSFTQFEQRDKDGTLSDADRAEWERVNAAINEFGGSTPQPPSAWDRPVNTWVYIVGCGVLSVPWCFWALWNMSRRRWRLDDDGTLSAPEGTWSKEQIAEIDMSRWMDKSVATVKAVDGKSTLLDDYKYKHVDRIVGAIASRLHPDDWTADARPVKKAEDVDATKQEAASA